MIFPCKNQHKTKIVVDDLEIQKVATCKYNKKVTTCKYLGVILEPGGS